MYTKYIYSKYDLFSELYGCGQVRNLCKIIGVALVIKRSIVPHRAIGVMLNFPNVGVVATTTTYTKFHPWLQASSVHSEQSCTIVTSTKLLCSRTRKFTSPVYSSPLGQYLDIYTLHFFHSPVPSRSPFANWFHHLLLEKLMPDHDKGDGKSTATEQNEASSDSKPVLHAEGPVRHGNTAIIRNSGTSYS